MSKKFWKCIRLPLSLAWTRSSVKKEDPKQPSGKVHIKACIAKLYNSKDCYKDCH